MHLVDIKEFIISKKGKQIMNGPYYLCPWQWRGTRVTSSTTRAGPSHKKSLNSFRAFKVVHGHCLKSSRGPLKTPYNSNRGAQSLLEKGFEQRILVTAGHCIPIPCLCPNQAEQASSQTCEGAAFAAVALQEGALTLAV